jgi:hypothetical protein
MPVDRLVDEADDHVLDTSTDGAALKCGWIRDRFMFRDFTDDQPALALAVRTAFGLWFRVVFFHRADDELAVALAQRTVARSVEALQRSQA